jgi:hypothetical protein
VERLMQEQRSREAKKAEETLAPTQVAQLSMAAAAAAGGDLVARVRPRRGGEEGDRRRKEDSVELVGSTPSAFRSAPADDD